MTISTVYRRYTIMPNLQQHMLRVAGVAMILADSMKVKVERDAIVTACLLHDMGNIIKFDLLRFPEFIQPQGIEFWQQIKTEFIEKYGHTTHQATVNIARELEVSERVINLIDAIGFNREKDNFETDDYSRKICAYADMRVAPAGVTTLEDRLEDARVRYRQAGKKDTFHYVMKHFLQKIELQLTKVSKIDPQSITQEEVEQQLPQLKEWQVGS